MQMIVYLNDICPINIAGLFFFSGFLNHSLFFFFSFISSLLFPPLFMHNSVVKQITILVSLKKQVHTKVLCRR